MVKWARPVLLVEGQAELWTVLNMLVCNTIVIKTSEMIVSILFVKRAMDSFEYASM